MLTLLTIFIVVLAAGFGFWFYNKRQVKNLADQIEDKNAVINAFRSHVEETAASVEPVVEKTQQSTVQKNNSQQKSKNGGNKNRQNGQGGNNGKKKSFEQKTQPSQGGKSNPSPEKKNRPKPRNPKTQQ